MPLTLKTIIKIIVILLSIITYIALILLAKKWYKELILEEQAKQPTNSANNYESKNIINKSINQ